MNSYRIIEYLKNKGKLKYYVFVSATSQHSTISTPKNILDWDLSNIYHSQNEKYQSLRLDFPLSNVFIENFSIKTAVNRDPYNWVFEGSYDGTVFTTLYENKAKKLCEWGAFDSVQTIGCTENIVNNFNVNKQDYYKSFRIRQTGTDSNNENYLVFSALEIIGKIHLLSFSCYRKNILHFIKTSPLLFVLIKLT